MTEKLKDGEVWVQFVNYYPGTRASGRPSHDRPACATGSTTASACTTSCSTPCTSRFPAGPASATSPAACSSSRSSRRPSPASSCGWPTAPAARRPTKASYYIQHEMTGGWLLRGIHHFMAQAMVVVMALHMLQVVWDGAYRAPREVNYWLGLVLMQLVLGLGLTGYLLPWDQKGYWATNVATNLATLVPVVGKEMQQLAVGGNEYGHHTLTRFFALHAGVLPALLVIFLVLHIAIFRRHGIMAKITPGRPDEYLLAPAGAVRRDRLPGAAGDRAAAASFISMSRGLSRGNLPAAHRGAELGAPADPAEQYSAARPEWYYLFLFQLLKYFPGTAEIIGAIVIPGVVMTILFLLPFIGRFEIGHRFNQAFIVLLARRRVGVLTGAGAVRRLLCLAGAEAGPEGRAKARRLARVPAGPRRRRARRPPDRRADQPPRDCWRTASSPTRG